MTPRDTDNAQAPAVLGDRTALPAPSRARRLRRSLLPLLVLAAAVAIFAGLLSTREVIVATPPEERVWAVEAAAVTIETTRPRLPLFGQVVAGRAVDLRPLVAGRIAAVGPDFHEGGFVAEGDAVVSIDPFDFEAARALRAADLAEAQAALREVEADLAGARARLEQDLRQLALLRQEAERRRQLHGRGTVSQRALDDAELTLSRQEQAASQRRNDVERLTARIDRQQATIRRAEVALELAERDLAETRLVSPFGGWLVDLDAEVGKRVGVGERVARLVDASRLEIRLLIPNDEFGQLAASGDVIGRELVAVWRMGEARRRLPARIVRLEGEIDAASGGVTAFARLTGSPEDLGLLRAGAFVEVALEGAELAGVARLPASALFDGDTVYRIGPDERIEAVQVAVLAREEASLLLRGPLAEGERIVLTRFPEIAAGLKVEVP